MVPKGDLPGFWIFMYRVSPLTYLISTLLSTSLAGTEVECSDLELLRFQSPEAITCGDYMEPFMGQAGGALKNSSAIGLCEFCPLRSTDDFLQQFDVAYENRWRDYGIMWGYIVFNIGAAVFLYWLMRVPKKSLWAGWVWKLK